MTLNVREAEQQAKKLRWHGTSDLYPISALAQDFLALLSLARELAREAEQANNFDQVLLAKARKTGLLEDKK